jgi:hypothetical protein
MRGVFLHNAELKHQCFAFVAAVKATVKQKTAICDLAYHMAVQ